MTTLSEEQQNYLQILVIILDVGLPTLKSFFERIYAQIGNSKEKFNTLISQFHKQYNENASFTPVSDEEWKQERTFGWYLQRLAPFGKGIPSKKKTISKTLLFSENQRKAFEILETLWIKFFSGRIRGLSKSQFEETKNTLSNALKELTKDDSVIEQIDQIQKRELSATETHLMWSATCEVWNCVYQKEDLTEGRGLKDIFVLLTENRTFQLTNQDIDVIVAFLGYLGLVWSVYKNQTNAISWFQSLFLHYFNMPLCPPNTPVTGHYFAQFCLYDDNTLEAITVADTLWKDRSELKKMMPPNSQINELFNRMIAVVRERNLRFPWTIMEQVRSQLVAIQDTNEVIIVNPHAPQESDVKAPLKKKKDKKGNKEKRTSSSNLQAESDKNDKK